MQPPFHTGDLALVRPASAYHVGDIVAYRSRHAARHRPAPDRRGHAALLHLQGRQQQLARSRACHPRPADRRRCGWRCRGSGADGCSAATRRPRWRSLAGLAVPARCSAARAFTRAPAAQAPPRARAEVAARKAAQWRPRSHDVGAIGSYGAVAVALLALVGCAGSRSSPGRTPAGAPCRRTCGYRQSGAFAYAASTIPGAVYDRPGHDRAADLHAARRPGAGAVRLRAACAGRRGLSGTASPAPSCWHRRTAGRGRSRSQAPTPFAGAHVAVAGIVHLRRLERFLQRVADRHRACPVRASRSRSFPSVHVHGTIAGQPFRPPTRPSSRSR